MNQLDSDFGERALCRIRSRGTKISGWIAIDILKEKDITEVFE